MAYVEDYDHSTAPADTLLVHAFDDLAEQGMTSINTQYHIMEYQSVTSLAHCFILFLKITDAEYAPLRLLGFPRTYQAEYSVAQNGDRYHTKFTRLKLKE